MRYYVFSVQYNQDAQAENRTVPKAFNTENEAIREFHYQLGVDMNTSTLGWSLCVVINSENEVLRAEKWVREPVEE